MKKKILFGISLFLLYILIINQNRINIFENSLNNTKDFDQFNGFPLSQSKDYTQFIENAINFTFNQLYQNETTIYMSFNETSNSSFSIKTPEPLNLNNSFANLTINDIFAYNMTIENDLINPDTVDTNLRASPTIFLFSSFILPDSCRLQNISVLGGTYASTVIYFNIFNSSWNGTNYIPDKLQATLGNIGGHSLSLITPINDILPYNNFSLNNDNTSNSIWFLGLNDSYRYPWCYHSESSNSIDYKLDTSISSLTEVNGDFCVNYTFSPLNSTPSPSAVNLQINGTNVENGIGNNGTFNKVFNINPNTDYEYFNFTSKWPNLSWTVNQRINNYTSKEMPINCTFNVSHNQDVIWNISHSMDYFDNNFSNYSIQYNLPTNWSLQIIYKNLIEINQDYLNISIKNNFKYVFLPQSIAGNGLWTLIFNTYNLAGSITTNNENSIYKNIFSWLENVSTTVITKNLIELTGNFTLNITKELELYPIFSSSVELTNSEIIFDDWDLSNVNLFGRYLLQVFWHNQTDVLYIEKNITVVASTNFIFTGISENYESLNDASSFNISWVWYNLQNSSNYTDATFEYRILENATNDWQPGTVQPDGIYNVTIDPTTIPVAGDYTLEINMTRDLTDNATYAFPFKIVINSTASPLLVQSNLNVIRGNNATLKLNYNETLSGNSIPTATIKNISTPNNLEWSVSANGGEYTIQFNTSRLDVNINGYDVNFNISRTGFLTRVFTFNINVSISPSRVQIINSNTTLLRKDNQNLIVDVLFEDITNVTNPIKIQNANLTQFKVVYAANEQNWPLAFGVTALANPGDYRLNISTSSMDAAVYNLKIGARFDPNHDYALSNMFSVEILGNITTVNQTEIRDMGNNLLTLVNNRYSVYANNKIAVKFFYYDVDQANLKVSNGSTSQYWVSLNGTNTDAFNITFDMTTNLYSVDIDLSGLSVGDHDLVLKVGQMNYRNASLTFPITIIPKLLVNISLEAISDVIMAGQSFTVTLKVTYFDTSTQEWLPLAGKAISISTIPVTQTLSNTTTADGLVSFTIPLPLSFSTNVPLNITISFPGSYNLDVQELEIKNNIVKPAEVFPMWIVYLMALVLGAVVVVPIYNKKVIQPKKQRYTELVMSSSTVFDDAINLKHVLIIFKNTGTCIFFKSFGEDQIDPDLISGFLSAVQSFGKEIRAQKSLNELAYGDNVLLFSDGELIRVTLVLGKQSSPFMKRNLAAFVGKFESVYANKLKSWKGSLNAFSDAGPLIDDVLNTSVILPHELSHDKIVLRKVSSGMAKELIRIAKGLTSDDRNFIFLAQLMAAAKEELKKDPAEVILGINELREKGVLKATRIEEIGQKPTMSEDEMRQLAERVAAIEGKSDQEKQDLIMQLVEMPANEREAILSSLKQSVKITTSLTGETIETQKFADVKAVKTEINRLDKEAKKAWKEERFDDAIRHYEIAEINAYQWNLDLIGHKYGSLVLQKTVLKLQTLLKKAKKEGAKLEKEGKFDIAKLKYDDGLAAAHDLFKLGFAEIDEDIRFFNKKSMDCAKRSGEITEYRVVITKENLLNSEKLTLKKLKAAEKAKDFLNQLEMATKLIVIANNVFQLGVFAYSDTVKKYKSKLEEIKKAMTELGEEKLMEYKGVFDDLNGRKPQVLDFAAQSESNNDIVNAVVAYEQVMVVYFKTGDSENAMGLVNKINDLLQKIPDIKKVIADFRAEAAKLTAANDADGAMVQNQYADAMEEALFISKK